ncbi:MAG: glycosyltransferase, partial [Chryseobacterium sp.]
FDTFVWICVAHFKYNKDYQTLFKAMELLKDRKIRLDIIGNLHGARWPLEVIKKNQLQHKIRLLGQLQTPQEHFRNANAFVLSSFSEGMPNAVLEAMANSKPVVLSDIECNEELVLEAKCGFLFERGNEVDLAHKMTEVMELSQKERTLLGRSGRRHIEENFSEQKVMKDWLKVIDDLSSVPSIGRAHLTPACTS